MSDLLGVDHVVEHWTCQEEGDVSVNVKLGQQLLDRRQPRGVVILDSGLENVELLMWRITWDMLEARNVPNWTKVS